MWGAKGDGMTQLADWLRAQMKARKVSQRALAKYSGVSKGQISRILREGHTPGNEDLVRLAVYFKFDPLTLMALTAGLDGGDSKNLHPTIQSLTEIVKGLDLSLQAALAEAWAKNLELAMTMLEEGRKVQAQEPPHSP